MATDNNASGNDAGKLTAAELRRRWTIELTSLRRRQSPTSPQQARIRELQMFLAALDPLRRLEIEWRAMVGFPARFRSEVAAQAAISDPAYRQRVLARVLVAFSGRALPDPGCPCLHTQAARQVCEDHGEDWRAMLDELREGKYLRKADNGEYSVGGPGYHLAEKAAKAAAAPGVARSDGVLFERLSPDVQQALGLFKIAQGIGAEAAVMRTLPHVAPTEVTARVRRSTPAVAARPTTKPKPKAIPAPVSKTRAGSPLDQLLRLEKASTSATHVIHILKTRKIVEVVENMQLLSEEPADAVWQCGLEVAMLGNAQFSAVGGNQREARRLASTSLLEALKIYFRELGDQAGPEESPRR